MPFQKTHANFYYAIFVHIYNIYISGILCLLYR